MLFLLSCGSRSMGPLILVENKNGEQGYVNQQGDTVISAGKYQLCYSDTFNTIAFVHHTSKGLVAITRDEEVLFHVFPYDNGPDYPSEGLFRIIENDKIGYANMEGRVVIKPKYPCAYPFENGRAKVAYDCKSIQDGEHSRWESEEWFYIDKTGKVFSE